MGNRADCAAHRVGNDVRASVEMAGLGAATYGKAFKWNTSLNTFLKKAAKGQKEAGGFIAEATANNKGVKKFAANVLKRMASFNEKVYTKLAKTTGRQKLLGLLGMAALAGLIGLNRKHAFKEGNMTKNTITLQICKKLPFPVNKRTDKHEKSSVLLKRSSFIKILFPPPLQNQFLNNFYTVAII